MPRDVGVIIVAAGQGSRLGGEVPKQFRELAGVPILLRALRPFASHAEVAHVVLVLPAAALAAPPAWLQNAEGGLLSLVAGGMERGDSVAAGLLGLPDRCRTVLVHDAARPLVQRELIDAVIETARSGSGAVPAVPVGDTLKEAQGEGAGTRKVVKTLSRERLWQAQTPQGFPREILVQAYRHAQEQGLHATDDATLVELLGAEVRIVPGSPRNIKVTTAEDLALAEMLLERSRA